MSQLTFIYQDTEDFDFVQYSVVVKLTADQIGHPPSEMRVVGAPIHFEYGAEAGQAGCFRARLFHASVAPRSATEHYKLVFFFKGAAKPPGHDERRRKRASAAGDAAKPWRRSGVLSQQCS